MHSDLLNREGGGAGPSHHRHLRVLVGVPMSPPGGAWGGVSGRGSYSGGGSVPAVVSGQPGIGVNPVGVTSVVPEGSRRNT